MTNVVMVSVSSILTLQLIKCLTYKYITMMIKSKITGRDISTEFSALMRGLITNDEFELITLTIK